MFILVVIAQSLVEADAALQNGFYSKTIQLKVQPFFQTAAEADFFCLSRLEWHLSDFVFIITLAKV